MEEERKGGERIGTLTDGALLIDKPVGPTSFDVIRAARRVLSERCMGHAGTLDPLASGLLIVLLGRATRLQEVFRGAQKVYTGRFRFGLSTDTDDITGTPIARAMNIPSSGELSERLTAVRERFLGRIQQVPPRFSAIKVAGERSYTLARRGKAVVHAPREVVIEELMLFPAVETSVVEHATEWNAGTQLEVPFSLRCSSGTYVRSLARDLGAAIGIPCCVSVLRRHVSDPLRVEDAIPLASLVDREALKRGFRPLNELVNHLPQVVVTGHDAKRIRHGNQRVIDEVFRVTPVTQDRERFVAICDGRGELQAIVERVRCHGTGGEHLERIPKATGMYRIRCVLSPL